jgi:hypothetical protein
MTQMSILTLKCVQVTNTLAYHSHTYLHMSDSYEMILGGQKNVLKISQFISFEKYLALLFFPPIIKGHLLVAP